MYLKQINYEGIKNVIYIYMYIIPKLDETSKPLCSLNHIAFTHLKLPQFRIAKFWHEAPNIILELL
jgi:hypothetical protein